MLKLSNFILLVLLLNLMHINVLKAVGAHVHGQAYMTIVLDQKDLTIKATLAAYDIVGFEHQPDSESGQHKINTAVKTLLAAEDWINIEEGECVKQNSNVDNPFKENHDESHHGEGSHHDDSHSHHSDFQLSIGFKCENPQAISGLQIKLSQVYSNIQDVEVQWLVHNKQGLAHIHGNDFKVDFE